ncbi:LysR family transcriptional regulator [bacterium]|nr:LysR family transcriptional regulator [bacterium]
MTQPLDLNALQLIRLVAKFRSFSQAAEEAGLSQSALSRQVSNAESRLGLKLFERTTRQVKITKAGAILLRETAAIPNLLQGALRRIEEECLNAIPTIKIAISNEIALAHIPGIFNVKPAEAKIVVSQETTKELQNGLCEARYDLGIFSAWEHGSDEIKITHRMSDPFILVAPANQALSPSFKQADQTPWILPPWENPARALIDTAFPNLSASMEIENFDLMIQLVALGHGCAFVPRRALSSFTRKKLIQKIPIPRPLVRQLIVAAPKNLKPTAHVESFVRQILFS